MNDLGMSVNITKYVFGIKEISGEGIKNPIRLVLIYQGISNKPKTIK